MSTPQDTEKKVIAIVHGDITAIAADAIVNSAHETLLPGAGVSGAIHQKAGPSVGQLCQAYYDEHGAQQAAAAVPTAAGNLAAQYIIHAVGPRWQGGQQREAELLAKTYQNILSTADQIGARTVSIPAISVGIFAFPLAQATQIALKTLAQQLSQCSVVQTVIIVCFEQEIGQSYAQIGAQIPTAANVKIVDLTPSYGT